MDKRTKLLVAAGAALAAIGVGTGVGIAASSDEAPLTGTVLDRATAAALEEVGGGTVIETEAGDDGAAYGVEIRLDDGSVVEVSLDERFRVTDTQDDDADTEDEADDTDD